MTHREMALIQKPRPDTDKNAKAAHAKLEELFHAQWDSLCDALYHFTGDSAEAEDLAIEAFIQLWRHPPARAENLGGWLYRVATRLGVNHLRATARREHYELSANLMDITAADPTPESRATQHQEQARVRAVLAQLNDRQARLLLLRQTGFSYQEIAATLEINPASVGTLLARAEQAFCKLYGVESGGDHASE